MSFHLSVPSLGRLVGVHPDLVRVVKRAVTLSPFEFQVCQGLRTLATEAAMVKAGKSLTMHSLHLPHTFAGVAEPVASAVDLDVVENGTPDWHWDRYVALNAIMQHSARIENVPVEWGGNWTDLKDGDHWQLPRARYPA